MSKILVVDDEQSIAWGLSRLGTNLGHDVRTVPSAEEGLLAAEEAPPDLVLLDVRLPGVDGLTAIEPFRRLIGDTPIVVMTAFGDLDTAVKAVRSGAFEYLLKPFDLDEVRAVISRALGRVAATAETPDTEQLAGMVGQTPVMQALFKRIALVAASDASVLIQGESGVGKELAARAIHRYSSRCEAPFVAVNAAALNESVAESELFGHVAGAFTGAQAARDGLLVQARGGTLFLDEIADIPAPLQVKLLRAIEEQEVLPVGADTPVTTSFRVVAATHQDLTRLVRAGEFRHDLYYRICAFEVTAPALRDRADDIPALASHFAALAGGRFTFADETLEELKRRDWFGNVRELRNAVEHAAILARTGVAYPEHLPPPQPRLALAGGAPAPARTALIEASIERARELLSDPDNDGAVYERFLREVERPLLDYALRRFDNEYAPAARALGVHRTTLKRKVIGGEPNAATTNDAD